MNKPSKTELKRLSRMRDEDIDTSDIPELNDAFFQNAELHVSPKQPVTLRLDADVLAWFKSGGQGYQTRINQLLRRLYGITAVAALRLVEHAEASVQREIA